MTQTFSIRLTGLVLTGLLALASSAKAQRFIPQTTFDPDAAARRGAGRAFGAPGRSSGGGGIRTTENTGSRPPRRPSTPVHPTRTVPRPAPSTRPATPAPTPRRPITIGNWHSPAEFDSRLVQWHQQAKRDQRYWHGVIQRIRNDYRIAQQREDVRTMQWLQQHYQKAVAGYRRATDYLGRAEPFLKHRFPIQFTGSAISKKDAFYRQLSAQIRRNPAINGKPISVYYQNGRLKVYYFPSGRIGYGGRDISHLFAL